MAIPYPASKTQAEVLRNARATKPTTALGSKCARTLASSQLSP